MSIMPDRLHQLPTFDAAAGDVYLMRVVSWDGTHTTRLGVEIVTNVPQELRLWADIGYGWGADRKGGVTLALNILHRLIPWRGGQGCNDWHHELPCDPESLRYAVSFQDAFLVQAPYWGGRLPGHVLRDWVRLERHRWRCEGVDLSLVQPLDCWPGPGG